MKLKVGGANWLPFRPNMKISKKSKHAGFTADLNFSFFLPVFLL